MGLLDKINIKEKIKNVISKRSSKAIRISESKLNKLSENLEKYSKIINDSIREHNYYSDISLNLNYLKKIDDKLERQIDKTVSIIKQIKEGNKIKLSHKMYEQLYKAAKKSKSTREELERIINPTTDKFTFALSNSAAKKAVVANNIDEITKGVNSRSIIEDNHVRKDDDALAMVENTAENATVSNVQNNKMENIDVPITQETISDAYLQENDNNDNKAYTDNIINELDDAKNNVDTKDNHTFSADSELSSKNTNLKDSTKIVDESNVEAWNDLYGIVQTDDQLQELKSNRVKPNDKSIIDTDFREVPENSTIESKPLNLENKSIKEMLEEISEVKTLINKASDEQREIDQEQKECNNDYNQLREQIAQYKEQKEKILSEIQQDNKNRKTQLEEDKKNLKNSKEALNMMFKDDNENQIETKGKSL